ncbi:b-box zinc finger [Teladorsagia circumcincta]|uniref:B-box zinc finger n=1 Tax=Teladorsagia circumcincta TaxID=45464 RepID=A0A2G9TPJ5_TELCI|nr:b-box zinc finger [Teladorsagia circumcincta]
MVAVLYDTPDHLAEFLIDTSHETAEVCANCDQTKQPMYYCETCQQALCHDCRNTTHKARMFSAHRVVVAEESARVRGRVACAQHSEPYILYCTENKSLACIQCFNERPPEDRHYFVSIDAGYKSCTEKIEKWAMKLRLYQEEKREELEVRQRILAEHNNNYQTAKEGCSITSRSIDKLSSVRSIDPIEARTEIAKALEPFLGKSLLQDCQLHGARLPLPEKVRKKVAEA